MIAIPGIDKPKKVDGISIDFHFEDGHIESHIIGIEEIIDIVTCKECKNSHMTYGGQCKYCDWEKDDDDNYIECYFDGDHFCSYGERREK